jgi:glycosyltransferase involved in cell wall biosynthesis
VNQELPLVSIFMFVRNGEASIRRAIESVRAQTYPNIEFIVQDGASTDGTLEILRGYDGVQLVSEPDSGPNEVLWRALNRCNGEFIGSCLADEELLPDAVERAVGTLRANPDVGAVTGDAILTDLAGRQTGFWKSGPFNFIDYLFCDYTPYFVSSFFRRQSLLQAGLKTEKWGTDCVEFEIWCRLAACSRVLYVPETFAKYASHAGQSSNNERDVVTHFTGRLNMIAALCDGGGLLKADPLARALFIWGHARAFINHALGVGRRAIADSLHAVTKQTMAKFPRVELDGIPYDENYAVRQTVQTAWTESERHLSPLARKLMGPTRLARRKAKMYATIAAAAAAKDPVPLPPAPGPLIKARLYAQLAQRYEADGRLKEALELWRAAALLAGLRTASEQELRDRVGYTAVSG